ncbi:hypothetical protein FQN54_009138 [Arachnomyces sp. PD_36]|nr:hypothetical protein FQN54_009138 [Arachnomyces sp. PD_36]
MCSQKDVSTGFWTVTFANNPDILHQAAELLKELVGEISGTTSEWTAKIMFQPVPTIFSKHSVEKGGNVLGLDRATENLVLLLLDVTWDTPEEEIIFRAASEKMIAELAAYAGSVGGLNEFIYLDYADSTQNPLRGYGEENLQKLKRVSEKYDPDGVFQTAVPGGFKVSKA